MAAWSKRPGCGSTAAPFNTQAVRIEAKLLHEGEILLGITPPVAGHSAPVAMPDFAGHLLPHPPLVVGVVALHLVRRCGRAPQEARGEL